MDWVKLAPVINMGINLALLGVGAAILRKFTRLEFQVETMWKVFERKFGEDGGGE